MQIILFELKVKIKLIYYFCHYKLLSALECEWIFFIEHLLEFENLSIWIVSVLL